MTFLIQKAPANYNAPFSIALIVVGMLIIGLDLQFYVDALQHSSSVIPSAPDVHFSAPKGIAAVFAAGSKNFDLQSILGMLLALLFIVSGPALLISEFLRSRPPHRIVVIAVTFPLFLLNSINIDWLFVQFLNFDGLPWLLSMSIFSVFSVKSSISITEFLNKKTINKICISSLCLSSAFATLALLFVKTLFN